MPLSAADLGKLGDTPITIQSTFFPNIYLRMDGTGVTSFTGSGGGTVNCQYGTGTWTGYKVRPQADGSYAFESVAFPNVFLRMDGTEVPATMAGGGRSTASTAPTPTRSTTFAPRRMVRSPSSRRPSRVLTCAW
ncbi:hypothetical protein NCG97_00885 [Streptomyces lydicamycinicus]|uniref:hypothetical protein n=1 Tax=Streptomyces lydicamycinicus TaxID=1546107 RepID=UPI002034F660|nr:hypothetical protein [Streptomyces lydicamycinicus]URZ99545.1 hypothetical protein NCG97_00885 [Streptomyces lydicamycinicus]